MNNAKIVYKTNHSPTTSFALRRYYHRTKRIAQEREREQKKKQIAPRRKW
jgi:hypothetical protein